MAVSGRRARNMMRLSDYLIIYVCEVQDGKRRAANGLRPDSGNPLKQVEAPWLAGWCGATEVYQVYQHYQHFRDHAAARE